MLEGIGLRLLGFVLDWFADRTNARMRLDSASLFAGAVMYDSGGGRSWASHVAHLLVYNAGRHRFTVNAAGWRAKDGERLAAHPERPVTVEPGAPEAEYSRGADEVLAFHSAHGGITHSYVHLAGDKKPKDRRVRSDWITEVEATASKPKETTF